MKRSEILAHVEAMQKILAICDLQCPYLRSDEEFALIQVTALLHSLQEMLSE